MPQLRSIPLKICSHYTPLRLRDIPNPLLYGSTGRWRRNSKRAKVPLDMPYASFRIERSEATKEEPRYYPYVRFLIPPENKAREFDKMYLRDTCSCERCVDPSTSQKLFETAGIPPNIDILAITNLPDGAKLIDWKNEIPGYHDHSSIIPSSLLTSNIGTRSEAAWALGRRKSWDCQVLNGETQTFDFLDYVNSEEALHQALCQLHRYGIVFLKSIPQDPLAIKQIANRIGPLRNTFYGETWDVRSMPSAKNVAYTSQHLGFHMDLLYMANPPGLQILHTMKSSAQGGESLFSDGLRALHGMLKSPSRVWDVLKTYHVTYRYKNDGHWYQYSRPTIENEFSLLDNGFEVTNIDSAEVEINWSPPFQAPFDHLPGATQTQQKNSKSQLCDYIEAARIFKSKLESDDAVYEIKMEEGTCAIFDNRRILHARKAYSNTSERWLRGAYIDKDPFKSRLRVLNEKLGKW